MTKRIVCFTLLALFTCAAASFAQVGGGVKGGLNLANVSFDAGGVSVSLDSRSGAMGGAFLDVPLAGHIALQPEVLFVMKGANFTSGSFDVIGAGSGSLKITTLDVPVLVRVDIPTTGKVVPYVFGGPNIGFPLSAKASATASGTTQDEDVKSDLKGTDFGIAFGGGVRFGRFLAEARYTLGLTNILTDTASESGTVTAKHRGLAFLGGVRF